MQRSNIYEELLARSVDHKLPQNTTRVVANVPCFGVQCEKYLEKIEGSGGPRNFPKTGQTRLSYQILDKIAIYNHESKLCVICQAWTAARA
jgi:hypothetical protein